jgi:hypothetical protein
MFQALEYWLCSSFRAPGGATPIRSSVAVLDSLDTVGKHGHVEVHQKTKRLLRMPKIREHLRLMNRENSLD